MTIGAMLERLDELESINENDITTEQQLELDHLARELEAYWLTC